MNLSVIFCNKGVEIKKGQVNIFKGSITGASKKLKDLHEKFVSKECIDNITTLLHECFKSVIENIQVEKRVQKDIAWDLAEELADGIVGEIAETKVPCVTIIQEKSSDEVSFPFVAVSENGKTIYRIVLHVATGRIDINIKKGNITFE